MRKKYLNQSVICQSLEILKSDYSKQYAKYMLHQYPYVQKQLYAIQNLENGLYYKLRYPLGMLLNAVSKRLLLNIYECLVFGYLLSTIFWEIDSPLIQQFKYEIPDIIFLNDPTDYAVLKKLTLFLYFTGYTIKQFLNDNIEIYLSEMTKIFPNFEKVYSQWLLSQPTTNQILDPKRLNHFYKCMISQNKTHESNANSLVDRILYISPCYDIETYPKYKKRSSQKKLKYNNQTHQEQRYQQSFI